MPDELSQLVAELSNPDPQKRLEAAEQLARLGPDACPAAVDLVKACGDESEEVREHIVAALEEIGPPRPEDSLPLAALLNNPSPDVGYWAATLLGRLKAAAADALPGLIDALERPAELSVRQRAAWALGEIGPAAASALNALKHAEDAGDPRLTRLARAAIEQIGGKEAGSDVPG